MKTTAIALLALALCPVVAQAADVVTESQRPNFVVILIDDMGYGDIGLFGSKLNRTPRLINGGRGDEQDQTEPVNNT